MNRRNRNTILLSFPVAAVIILGCSAARAPASLQSYDGMPSKAILLGKSPEALFSYCTTLGDQKPDINANPKTSYIECHVWAADVTEPSMSSRSHVLGASHDDGSVKIWQVTFGPPTQDEVEEKQRELMLRYGVPTTKEYEGRVLAYTWRFSGWHAYFEWFSTGDAGQFLSYSHGEAFDDRRKPD